ncbi:hypothetical protein C8Q69DRAFT_464955 [Paecilomyces variotii]|uniref:Uncharacterized protein n=1 Tax=Byssochlamys spectabilis TaxID=264951 RepID=A0A443HWZ4_BYSSP|nr:hypothetical protein C8Q69DRAFT_464955 [Paecilomyces variotii]RWQ96356.1 hypothetical protein C8Q69DRAFT_464955 [Paecilomyces variotii]
MYLFCIGNSSLASLAIIYRSVRANDHDTYLRCSMKHISGKDCPKNKNNNVETKNTYPHAYSTSYCTRCYYRGILACSTQGIYRAIDFHPSHALQHDSAG